MSEEGFLEVLRRWQYAIHAGRELGIPPVNILYKAVKYGPQGAAQRGASIPEDDHPDVYSMVQALTALRMKDSKAYTAFMAKYADRVGDTTLPIRLKDHEKAQVLGWPPTSFSSRAARARLELRKLLHTILRAV